MVTARYSNKKESGSQWANSGYEQLSNLFQFKRSVGAILCVGCVIERKCIKCYRCLFLSFSSALYIQFEMNFLSLANDYSKTIKDRFLKCLLWKVMLNDSIHVFIICIMQLNGNQNQTEIAFTLCSLSLSYLFRQVLGQIPRMEW